MIRRALRIVIIYVFAGLAWISISDAIFYFIIGTKAYDVAFMGSVSAVIFLIITGFILYKLINLHYYRLQTSEQQYRSYFDDNPTPMWTYDLKTLKFIKINHAAMSNYGYNSHEFHNLTILDMHPPGEERDTLKMLNNFEAPYKNSGVWKHQKKDGTNIFVHITSNLILSSHGKQVMMMATDITQRVQDEQNLKELNTGLVKQNVILAEIAWSQSHDVRRPLASIMGLTHLLQISDSEQDKQQCVKLIEQSADDLDLMIRNINDQIGLAMFKN